LYNYIVYEDLCRLLLDPLLCEGEGHFHAEKDSLLIVGLTKSGHVRVDDSGAQHKVFTHIGNEIFSWRSTTQRLLIFYRYCKAVKAVIYCRMSL